MRERVVVDWERISEKVCRERKELFRCREAPSVQEAAQQFIGTLYEGLEGVLVLLRLFVTLRYDQLPEDDRRFVDRRGRETDTAHLIRPALPVFTLLGTRGVRAEWNDRRTSSHFRCIPLASTAFVASLSMLSRQFESVGFDLGLIDAWDTAVTGQGRGDRFRGTLYIGDAGSDRDAQGRMVVPKQDFVRAEGIQSVFGFGSGYGGYPALVTLFAFSNRGLDEDTLKPAAGLLELFIIDTEELAGRERFFAPALPAIHQQ